VLGSWIESIESLMMPFPSARVLPSKHPPSDTLQEKKGHLTILTDYVVWSKGRLWLISSFDQLEKSDFPLCGGLSLSVDLTPVPLFHVSVLEDAEFASSWDWK